MRVEACCVQEMKRRRSKEHKCISERRTESAADVRRETLMQEGKSSVAEQ
jgi:hypothetical protein